MREMLFSWIVFAVVSCTGPSPNVDEHNTLHTIIGKTMGTTYTVKLVSADGAFDLVRTRLAIETRLDQINSRMSHYLVDSEVAMFNRSFTTEPYPLASETVDLIAAANEISRVSNGAFDITVGPFVDAWGFGPKEPPAILPGSEALEGLRAFVGYELLVIDREASTVQKRRKELSVDLSAIAKGHAVDAVAAILAELGLTDYLVEIGGELRAYGNGQQGRPWRVAIERPDAGQVLQTRIIELRDQSIATSGEYRNYYERDGVRVSHTIDPRTGRPVSHELLAVSVLAQYCALADARATALEVLGPVAGYALAIEQGWVALFLIRGEDGRLVERATPTFNQPLE